MMSMMTPSDHYNNTVAAQLPSSSSSLPSNSSSSSAANQTSYSSSNAETYNVDIGPVSVAVNPATNMVYVTKGDSTVSVIDGSTNSVVKTLFVNGRLYAITVNPTTNMIYVAMEME